MNLRTTCVHTGPHTEAAGGIVTPIYPATAYEFLDQENVYPRYFNTPNQKHVVETIAALERAEDGVLFSSGMAAVSAVMLALLRPGDHAVLLGGLYGGTHAFVTDEFDRLGISYTFAGPGAEEVAAAVTDETRLVYIESPTNPLLTVIDLRCVAEAAAEHGATTVIDNTFASPVNQRPIEHDIDVVIHSGTKYLGGHSDLCCGVAVGDAERIARIRTTAIHYGGSLNALDCYLLERSLKTLSVRVERQTTNAGRIAQHLKDDSRVRSVYYPGLESHPDHEVAARQMDGFGAMLSFELDGGAEEAEAFMRRLQHITPALSLGAVESTICTPATTSHIKMTPEDRRAMGVTDGLMRLSVGIEDVDDLVADVDQALAAV